MVKKVISKEVIVKRVDTNLKIRKAPTKSELEIQVKKLQQTNDALEESNRKKIELLERFDEKIMNLEKKIDDLSSKEIMLCKGTQTEADLSSKVVIHKVSDIVKNVAIKQKTNMILMLTKV